uniref:Uncharacterized protein n=1 Tax=Oryza meridionalis TaxID=40149 RepID=A0A0E0CKJ4_9ORYZ
MTKGERYEGKKKKKEQSSLFALRPKALTKAGRKKQRSVVTVAALSLSLSRDGGGSDPGDGRSGAAVAGSGPLVDGAAPAAPHQGGGRRARGKLEATDGELEAADGERAASSRQRTTVASTAPPEEAGQGARWPDLVAVVPERDDHHHDVVLVLLGREHGHLKPVDGAELDLRHPPPPPLLLSPSTALSLTFAAYSRSSPPLLPLPPLALRRCSGSCRDGGGPKRGERARERERREVEGESVAGDTVGTGTGRCNALLIFVPGRKAARGATPSQGARGLARERRGRKN